MKITIAGEHIAMTMTKAVKVDHLKELSGWMRPGGTPDTDGRSRVYGGDANLVHVKDGTRAVYGARLAELISAAIRDQAVEAGLKTREEVNAQNLCPGCYMIVMYNALVVLACQNGQPLAGLGRTLAATFHDLEQRADLGIDNCRESIHVLIG